MSYETRERTVTITQSEYTVLQQNRNELQDAHSQLGYYRNLLNAQEKALSSFSAQADAAQGRIDSLSSELQNVMERNRDIEKVVVAQNDALHAMNKRHKEQVKQITSDLQKRIEQVRDEGAHAVERAYRDFSDAMQQNNRLIERSIQATAENILDRVDDIAADLRLEMGEIAQQVERMGVGNRQLAEMAHEFYDAARAALKDVEDSCPHHRALCSEQLVAATARLADAKANLDIVDGGNEMNSGAAQASARMAFTEAMALRARAYAMESIWQEHHQLAMSSLVTAESRVEAARRVAVGKDPGTGEVIRVDADYWTEGGLSGVEASVAGLAERLRSDGEKDDAALTIEQIDGVREALDRAAIEADEVANDAYIAVALSQQRADNADDFADLVEALNLDVGDVSYYEGDQRKSLRVWLANPVTGLKVTLTFEPGGRGGSPGQLVRVDVTERGDTSDDGIATLLEQIDEYLYGCGGNPSEIVRSASTAASVQACQERADIDAWRNGASREFAETAEGTGDWAPGDVSARAMGQ